MNDGRNSLIEVNCKGSYRSSLFQFPLLWTNLNIGLVIQTNLLRLLVSPHSRRQFSLALRLSQTGCTRNFSIERFGGDSGNTAMTDND